MDRWILSQRKSIEKFGDTKRTGARIGIHYDCERNIYVSVTTPNGT